MILTPDQRNILYNENGSKNGLINPALRWPKAVVFYKFATSIPQNHRSLIINSLKEIEKSTCIRFQQGVNSKNDYISVTTDAPGCFSNVGYLGKSQRLNLGYGCMIKRAIVHEFLHALGFFHQQSSADRDNFINIHWENIQKGTEYNFDKYSSAKITNFGTRYDYGSIMHYGPLAF
uniref:Metalloendopeptidase n=1 Tax=Megaselia scalaris TaxID=36166 RepID=T1H2Y9_MEGSC